MIAPPTPDDEPARLASLYASGLLGQVGSESLDRVTRLAQHLFGVRVALVTLIDEHEQCFVSSQGVSLANTPRSVSFCGHAVASNSILVVEDARRDERFADNPMVVGDPHIRFYAGHPIRGIEGQPLGTVCVIGDQPRIMTATDLAALADLAAIVETEIISASEAIRDELTGLLNRRGLITVAESFFEHARRSGESLVVVMADLDRLKVVNDIWGHAAGDASIRGAADLLREVFRASDTIARVGGDEFVVLMPATDAEQASHALERVEAGQAIAHQLDDLALELSLSVGSAVWPDDPADSFDDLLDLADRRMYAHKAANRTAV